MTFIAIHTSRHRADIATDTLSYSGVAQTLGHTTKVNTLHHLAAAVVTQGDHVFGRMAVGYLSILAEDVPDFTVFAREAPDVLRKLWADFADGPRELPDSTVYLVGYSPASEEFAAWALASEHDFMPLLLDGFHVTPSPTYMRPSDLELNRIQHVVRPGDMETLRGRPEPSVPQGRAGWIALALRARQTRALAPVESGLKTFVAGDLYLTRLERGAVTTKRVYTFDDSGEEFRQMIAGTYHPQAQLGPCGCGSGVRYLDCHLVEHATEPCLCKSGKAFQDCCRVPVEQGARVVA